MQFDCSRRTSHKMYRNLPPDIVLVKVYGITSQKKSTKHLNTAKCNKVRNETDLLHFAVFKYLVDFF